LHDTGARTLAAQTALALSELDQSASSILALLLDRFDFYIHVCTGRHQSIWRRTEDRMNTRLHYAKTAPGTFAAMDAPQQYLEGCGLEEPLLNLINLRASQINGCAYCIDMHWKDLRAGGETEQRMYSLDAWRECPYYTERERAALEWTEAVTLITDGHVPDTVYDAVRPHFSEKELADLTFAVATINAWNRLSIAGRIVPGTYRAKEQVAS
jgi:AhpD family alkylhydroperoxidase